MVNLSIKQCYFPSAWKSAVITPIFKTGDPVNVTNYRPISILPVVSKVTEKGVCNQLVEHLNLGHFPLHPMQFGFRAHHSFKKAFDTVNHNFLLSKLSRLNFSTTLT